MIAALLDPETIVAPSEKPGIGSRGGRAVEAVLEPDAGFRADTVSVVGPLFVVDPLGEAVSVGGAVSVPGDRNGLRETSWMKVGLSQLASIFGSWGVGGTGVGSGAA
jgi:hypothetical protein